MDAHELGKPNRNGLWHPLTEVSWMLICTLRECAGMKRDITTISELPRNPDAFIIYEWELGNERTITFAGQDTICHTARYEIQIGWKSAISEFLCAIHQIANIQKNFLLIWNYARCLPVTIISWSLCVPPKSKEKPGCVTHPLPLFLPSRPLLDHAETTKRRQCCIRASYRANKLKPLSGNPTLLIWQTVVNK